MAKWLLGLLMALSAVPACAGPASLIPLPSRAVIRPVISCTELAAPVTVEQEGIAFRVRSAVIVPASAGKAEVCLVRGYAAPQTAFEIRLPTNTYTGRFLQGGCGGMCGVVGETIVPQCSNAHLSSGTFATAFNNGGHDGTGVGDATWSIGAPELREQFAHKATHAVAVATKALIKRFYGQPPTHSYFVGCSGGGREALMEVQRYPQDFDGVVAGSSVSMPAAMQLFLWEAHNGLDASGAEIFTTEAVSLLHRAVLTACDTLDGIRDDQIDDPRACHYNPAKLLCAQGASANCLTAQQVAAATAWYRGPHDADGHALYPGGAPYGAELGWVGPGSATRTGKFAAESFFKYLLFPGELPAGFSWRDWRFTRESLARLLTAGAPYDAAEPDISAFRDRGGKLILWQGVADNMAGAYGMLDYYQAVQDKMGGLEATRRFARMFLVPGGYHCAGGYIPYEQDLLGAMVNWVETGAPADGVIATATLTDGRVRQRPLYAYPTRTRYLGGDVNLATSFAPQAVRTAPNDGFNWPGSRAQGRRVDGAGPR